MVDHPPPSLGLTKRLVAWARDSSSWITRTFTAFLILYLSARAGLSYVDAPLAWENLADRSFIFAGFMVLLAGSIIREASRIRKERYANVFDKLQAIDSNVKDLNTYLTRQALKDTPPDPEDLKKAAIGDVEKVLDNLSDIFSMVTGTVCRTTIKLIYENGGTLYVYALARDSQSTVTNARSDKERLEKRVDTLEDNDDFSAIFDEKVDFFIENDLPARRDYRNTSFYVYGARPPRTSFISRWFTAVGWHLPYRSATVFPIRQLEPATGGDDDVGCIGFLTVDSAFRRVFKRRFDGPLGATVASALFHPLSVYKKLVDEAEQRA